MTLTHWLPPFTTRDKRGRQQSACGEFIDLKQHSNSPSCAECATYLAKDTALDAELDATFAEPFDPSMEVRHVDFDPTRGQQYSANRRDPRR